MDIEEIIKELQFKESTACVKTETADKDISTSTYSVKTERDVDIANQYQNKLVGNTLQKESGDDNYEEEILEMNINTKEEKIVLEVGDESSSYDKGEDSLPEIKTEELMLKSESEDDESKTGSATDLEESNDDEREMRETNIEIKKEKVVLEMKIESSSDDKGEDSLPEIKTEELMLKSEDDDSETGALWDLHMKDHIIDEKLTKKHGFDHCEYRNSMISSLDKHDKNSINKYDCDQCDYGTNMKSNLKKHIMAKHDKNSIKKYGCDQCNYRTPEKRNLKRHILVKHDKNSIKKYGCYQCDYRSHFKGNLKKHIMVKHDKNSIKKYGCNHCDYRTNVKCNLKPHIMSKHNEKYGCNHCDYRTHFKSCLINHIMAKSDKNSSNKCDCDQCDYSTNMKVNLKRHITAKLRSLRLQDPFQRLLETTHHGEARQEFAQQI